MAQRQPDRARRDGHKTTSLKPTRKNSRGDEPGAGGGAPQAAGRGKGAQPEQPRAQALPPPPSTNHAASGAHAGSHQQQHPGDGGPQHQEEEVPSSRLCVKNLPKYLTDVKLKEHFSAKGEVTDVKIMKTRDGQSRQLGFIGFKSVEEAAAALRYYNNTFIDASRITVEYARQYKDPSLARPWSKHSEGSSAHAKVTKTAKEVDGSLSEATALASKLKHRAEADRKQDKKSRGLMGALETDDPQLAEFLALMAPRSRAKLWANDELAPVQTLEDLKATLASQQAAEEEADAVEAGSSDDEYQELPGDKQQQTAGRGGFGRLGHKGHTSDGDSDGDDVSGGSEDGDEDGQDGVVVKDQVVVSEAVTDLDYLKSRMKKWDDDDDDDLMEGPGGVQPDQSRGKRGAGGAAAGGASDEEDQEQEEQGGEDGAQPMDVDQQQQPAAAGGAGAADAHAPIADPESAVRATSRLFIRNLAYSTTEADLLDLAGSCGDVSTVHLVIDRETKRSKGIAYIQYVMPDDAVAAYHKLDGHIFQGRLLHVLPAKAPTSSVVGVEEGPGDAQEQEQGPGGRSAAGSSFKAAQQEKRKADAGNRAAWNSLFMRPDTVQDAIAAHYGISKSELLDARGSSDLAVRVALGEAAVIQQTKTALADQGVNVESLEQAAAAGGKASANKSVARSPTTLLVKNLPFSTTEADLSALFARSGPVSRLVLPPSHTLALVEFCEPQDARAAFKALAYKKFQHVPLYLEWAPKDVFSTPPPAQPAAAAQPGAKAHAEPQPGEQAAQGSKAAAAPAGKEAKKKAAAEAAAQQELAVAGADDDEDEGSGCTIYVKNLAFTTTDATLKKHFDKVVASVGGVMHSARVARRKHPTSGELLSAGYGFVEVDTPQIAAAVISKLQASMLDHHKLSLQLAKRKVDPATAGAAKKAAKESAAAAAATSATGGAATKLVVRNVAFEATRKDIVGLFSPFGHLKSCRLPKKFDGNHRGFAFVEFVTKQEARNAVEGVTGTHLYGRRLVVEYAKEESGLDELRAKTASKSRADEDSEVLAAPAKRMKKNL